MKVETTPLNKDGLVEKRPFLRASLKGEGGCSLSGCTCSPGLWLSVSNGDIVMKIELTKEDVKALRKGRVSLVQE